MYAERKNSAYATLARKFFRRNIQKRGNANRLEEKTKRILITQSNTKTSKNKMQKYNKNVQELFLYYQEKDGWKKVSAKGKIFWCDFLLT